MGLQCLGMWYVCSNEDSTTRVCVCVCENKEKIMLREGTCGCDRL